MGKGITIDYLAEWDPSDERATWSGSTYGLYHALAKHYDVHRLDITHVLPPDLKAIQFGNRLLNKLIFRHCPRFFDHSQYYRSRLDHFYGAQVSADISIQIGDITAGADHPNFCYHDTNWLALDALRCEQPDTFAFSEFTYATPREIQASKQYQAHIYHDGTTILAMSHWLDHFTREHSDFACHYVGAGINTPAVTRPITRQPRQLLFIGRDFIRKGGDLVVAAFQRLHGILSDARLIIAGPQTPPPAIAGVPGIEFVGAVDNRTVADLMHRASVFVMPSRFEAFGIVFVEAMAAGMPIIGRDRFEMPYFVHEGSGLNITSSPDPEAEIQDLTTKMHTLLTDATFQQRATARAAHISQHYSWDAVAARAATVFDRA